MTHDYRILPVAQDMSDSGLMRTMSSKYGPNLWSIGTVRGRDKQCSTCGTVLPRGSQAYHPITNGLNRGDRICTKCVEKGAA